ncbi:hypothetical protein R1sor_014192 [Riccia sorocarpa]|uniref:Uncharacterized protein n=1 Tax=Riccia sorocarpa TaxID=122646 RepID=A0ABD3H8X8_9MARC
MKEHTLGVSIGPSVSTSGYSTFTVSSQDFQGPENFSQQQREFLNQRNMMSQTADQHPQAHGQSGGHSQCQQINMNEGAKASSVSTHDFLSLYADNSGQYAEHHENLRGLSSALTTKDFLQPLERGNHAVFREGQQSRPDKHPRQQEVLPHASNASPPAVMEQLLTSGLGVYNGGHGAPNYGRGSKGGMDLPSNAIVRMVGEANAEMRGRGGFSTSAGTMIPREEHDARSDLSKDQDTAVRGDNFAFWSNMRLKFGMLPPELAFHAPGQATTHMDNVQQPPVPNMPKQWPPAIQGAIDMAKRPIRVLSEDDEDDEEEYGDRTRDMRKEPLAKAEQSQKPEGKAVETRSGTPRSKHSATEQRRRSKINDRQVSMSLRLCDVKNIFQHINKINFGTFRDEKLPSLSARQTHQPLGSAEALGFQMLRELVPHSDQKRDKASFLLERNGSGPGDSCIEGTTVDASAYTKDLAPSAVSGSPLDMKQVAEASETGRHKAVSRADENGSSEQLPHNAQHVLRTSRHGANPSHEEKGVGKPLLSLKQHQLQKAYNTKDLALSSQLKQQSLPDAQEIYTSEGQGKHSSVGGATVGSHEQGDKPSEAETLQRARTEASSQQTQSEGDNSDLQPVETRQRGGSSVGQDTGNENASSFDDGTKFQAKQDRQNTYVSSPSMRNSQTTDNSQGQQHGNSCENAHQREGSPGGTTPSAGQEPLMIQGGVINVSSVYSQG